MVEEITRLDSPIDVMYLLHKAFRAHSDRTEELAAQAEKGGDLKQFMEAFDFWIKQLLYHATTEDKYMTGPLTDQQPARDNEAEHAELVRQAGETVPPRLSCQTSPPRPWYRTRFPSPRQPGSVARLACSRRGHRR